MQLLQTQTLPIIINRDTTRDVSASVWMFEIHKCKFTLPNLHRKLFVWRVLILNDYVQHFDAAFHIWNCRVFLNCRKKRRKLQWPILNSTDSKWQWDIKYLNVTLRKYLILSSFIRNMLLISAKINCWMFSHFFS